VSRYSMDGMKLMLLKCLILAQIWHSNPLSGSPKRVRPPAR
jgi:hypothetical protein